MVHKSFPRVRQNNVGCDEHEAEGGPQQNKPHPKGMTERRLVLVNSISSHHGFQMASGKIHEKGRDNILDPCAGVSTRDAYQGLQVVCTEGHQDRGYQSDEGKHNAIHHPGVGAAIPVEQGLPVVAKRDGDDGEVCANGEDRKQAEEVAQHWNAKHIAVVGKVESVHVVEQGAVEAEDGGKGEEHVKAQDQGIVC